MGRVRRDVMKLLKAPPLITYSASVIIFETTLWDSSAR